MFIVKSNMMIQSQVLQYFRCSVISKNTTY